jgi:hypothetical protein
MVHTEPSLSEHDDEVLRQAYAPYADSSPQTGQPQPNLNREVAAIEQRLDVTLFRAGRHDPGDHPIGLALLVHARVMGAAAALGLAAIGRS